VRLASSGCARPAEAAGGASAGASAGAGAASFGSFSVTCAVFSVTCAVFSVTCAVFQRTSDSERQAALQRAAVGAYGLSDPLRGLRAPACLDPNRRGDQAVHRRILDVAQQSQHACAEEPGSATQLR
jgi:hypothetical protein